MKLALTAHSERGKEVQKTANDYIQANFTIDKKHAVSITLKNTGNGVEVWETWSKKTPVLITTIK